MGRDNVTVQQESFPTNEAIDVRSGGLVAHVDQMES
jgi:hypothetical protein